MSPVHHQSVIRQSIDRNVQIKLGVSAKFMLASLLSLGILLFAMQLIAAENSSNVQSVSSAENWYAKNYQAQNSGNLVSLQAHPDTKMYVSNHKEEDGISMLENGYDLMGTSGFTAGDVPAEQALQHAKDLKADTVLVYSKSSAKTAGSKMQLIKDAAKAGKELTEKDLETEQANYDYYASYWAKLPAPLLGVHVIKLAKKQSQEDEKAVEEDGLKIIAVIKESAAAKANLQRGDVLIKLGDTVLEKPEQLLLAVKRYQGQTVPIVYERAGQTNTVQVAINQR